MTHNEQCLGDQPQRRETQGEKQDSEMVGFRVLTRGNSIPSQGFLDGLHGRDGKIGDPPRYKRWPEWGFGCWGSPERSFAGCSFLQTQPGGELRVLNLRCLQLPTTHTQVLVEAIWNLCSIQGLAAPAALKYIWLGLAWHLAHFSTGPLLSFSAHRNRSHSLQLNPTAKRFLVHCGKITTKNRE